MNKTFIFIIASIVVIVAGILGFWWYRDTLFSKEILNLQLLGPDTAKSGDEITYTVKYQNNGNFALENPKLIVQLPDNSLTEDSKTRLTQDLKDIYPGAQNLVQIKTRLLGKEGDLKTARAWLSYTPHNLSARYESDTSLATTISSSGLTLTYDLPSKIEKGKEITYSLNYFSNIDYPLENMSVKIDGVSGFNVESAAPVSLDNAEWKLPTLQKAQGGRISIKGLVTADPGTNLHFSARLGMWQDGNFIALQEASQDVQVINPLLFISQQINGSSNYIASPGELLHYQIFLRNIGTSSVDNLFVISKIDSPAFDLSSLVSSQGSARPNDNLIIFDSKQVPELSHLDPNQETSISFDIKLKDSWTPVDAQKNNVLLKNEVKVSDITQEFDTKVNSKLELAQKGYFAASAGFVNSGPIPPQVNQATTYTITWQAKNYFNDVKNGKVRASLPDGVALTANILPQNQISKFSLDSATREIVWSMGDMPAGTGIANAPPSISFQVSLLPSAAMQGKVAELIGQATILGEDQATGKTISSSAPAVDTSLPDDPQNSGGGVVH